MSSLAEDPIVINFYSKKEKYAWLSNFHLIPMEIDGLVYNTVEHYFQSEKFRYTDPDYAEKIRLCASPAIAKRLGRSRTHTIHTEWNTFRLVVMRKAIFHKFTFMKELLVSTKNAILQEASPSDYFWGVGKSGSGQNMLGKLIMEFRDSL
jgi:ribA/ribD-fused uncharacterized protein